MSLHRRLLGSLFLLLSPNIWASQLNMTPGVSEVSQSVYQLHMMIFYACCVIGLGVFLTMLYAIVRHRKSVGHKAALFHENILVEILWTVIPFIILVVMAIPATKTLILMDDTSQADLTVKITGYQWKWRYEYLDDGIDFFSNLSTPLSEITNKTPKGNFYLLEVDNPLVLPVGKKIRFLSTANDVIHSWWVPAFGFKKDTIPGFINESWTRIETPGTYRGQCAELCGVNHAYMPIVVEAKTPEDFEAWLNEQKAAKQAALTRASEAWDKDELMAQGEQVYQKMCAACHQADGQGIPGVFPAMVGSEVALGDIGTHIAVILRGVPGTSMQAFGNQLSDSDIAAVVTYERNGFGNNTGDLVQPSDIQQAR